MASENFLWNYYGHTVIVRNEHPESNNGDYHIGEVIHVHVKEDNMPGDHSYLILNPGGIVLFDHDFTVVEILPNT